MIVYSQIETVVSGRVRTVQAWGGGADDVIDAADEAGRVDHWREEKEMRRTALANAALNMPATSAGQTNRQTLDYQFQATTKHFKSQNRKVKTCHHWGAADTTKSNELTKINWCYAFHTLIYTYRRRYATDWIVLLSAEDHRTGGHLLLRRACWEMLSCTEGGR